MSARTRKCPACRKVNPRPVSKFCSRECRERYRREVDCRLYQTCPVCKGYFKRQRITRQFCSDACRKRAARDPKVAAPPPPKESKSARAVLKRLERLSRFFDEPYVTSALAAVRDRDRLTALAEKIHDHTTPLLDASKPPADPVEPPQPRPVKVAIPSQPIEHILTPDARRVFLK